MDAIRKYQINVVGETIEGLVIPTGFHICVKSSFKHTGGGELKLVVSSCTCLSNDCMVTNVAYADNKSYDLVVGDLALSENALLDAKVKADLETAYGALNVVIV